MALDIEEKNEWQQIIFGAKFTSDSQTPSDDKKRRNFWWKKKIIVFMLLPKLNSTAH